MPYISHCFSTIEPQGHYHWIGDCNGDVWLDIAFRSTGSNSITVLMNMCLISRRLSNPDSMGVQLFTTQPWTTVHLGSSLSFWPALDLTFLISEDQSLLQYYRIPMLLSCWHSSIVWRWKYTPWMRQKLDWLTSTSVNQDSNDQHDVTSPEHPFFVPLPKNDFSDGLLNVASLNIDEPLATRDSGLQSDSCLYSILQIEARSGSERIYHRVASSRQVSNIQETPRYVDSVG